jgi:VWFA-related protein
VRRTIALVVDDLSLSFESTYFVRRALRKFVDEQMVDGDLVAIVRAGAGIGAFQQFTTDKRILHAAIERVKWIPRANANTGAFAPLQPKLPTPEGLPEPTAGERTAEGIEREYEETRRNYFTVGTLGAVEYVVRGLSQLPGRKSVLMFSEGFALANTDADGFREGSPVLSSLRRLIDLANRSSVVIYSVDPRGVAVTGLTAADSPAGRSFLELSQIPTQRSAQLFESQGSLHYLSKETGGFAVVNTNNISGAVRRVLDDQSYYLVSYDPGDDSFDPVARRYNRIDVKVLRKGLTVRYRSGFFNVEKRETPDSTLTAMTPGEQFRNALLSPFGMSGITVRLNSLYGNDPRMGNIVRSLLHIRASDLKFSEENGKFKAAFEVLAASFGDRSQVVDRIGRSYVLDMDRKAYDKVLRDGFVYHFTFPVKKPGAYQYRVAVRDPRTGTMGSASQFIEVPDLKKKRLALSSIVVDNVSAENHERQEQRLDSAADETTAMDDTSLRIFKPGTAIRYGYEIYNATRSGARPPELTARIRVFLDGKIVLDGTENPIDISGQTDLERIKATGALSLGSAISTGEYVLQVIVTDKQAKEKRNLASQFIQFDLQR